MQKWAWGIEKGKITDMGYNLTVLWEYYIQFYSNIFYNLDEMDDIKYE